MILDTTFKRGLTALLAVTLISYMILQQDKIRAQAEMLLHSDSRISFLEASLQTNQEENHALREENENLGITLSELRDSIDVLNEEVTALQLDLKRSKTTLSNIQRELNQKKLEVATLQSQITKLQNEKQNSKQTIAVLQKDLNAKQQNIVQLNALADDESKIHAKTEEKLMAEELERKRLEQITIVTQSTQVSYHSVECKSSRSSKNLKKMTNDGSNWVFTTLVFDLTNTQHEKINEEYFRLKIVDTDTGEELPFNEANPAFTKPGNETYGFTFQWTKNPTEAVYINMQAKKGKNYDARIYFVNNDKEFILHNSTLPLVRNGKMVN